MAEPQDTLAVVTKVGAQTEILTVQLVKTRAEARVRPESIVGKPGKYFIEQKVNRALSADGTLEVFVSYTVSVKSEENAKEWLLIAPMFRVLYKTKNASEFASEHIDAFATFNGVYNTWPYLREHVQSTTDKMGFPTLTIHLYRINLAGAQSKSPNQSAETPAAKQEK